MMLDRLLRVSLLRLRGAERRLMATMLALQAAEAGIERAKRNQEALALRMDKQRALARELFVGASHARVAVEDMLMDMTSFDRAEVAAAETVKAAIEQRDAAVLPVSEAREALRLVQITVDKRSQIVRQERAKWQAARETVEEADTLEQWAAGRAG